MKSKSKESRASTCMVDFHGFLVASEHNKYLERMYEKEGEFWNKCRFKSKQLISGALECLGRVLVIADTPWPDVSEAELREMLTHLHDLAETGLQLTCLSSCTPTVRAILKLRQGRAQIQAKLDEANKKFDASNTKLNVIKQKRMELRKQLHFNRLSTINSAL